MSYSKTATENLLAVNADEPELFLLEIYHPDQPARIYVCRDSVDFVGFGHTWKAFQFDFNFPNDQDREASVASISFVNIGGSPINDGMGNDFTLSGWIDAADGGRGVKVRVIQTFRSDPFIELDLTFDLDSINVDQDKVTGQLRFNQSAFNNHAVARFFTPEWAPGVF